MSFFKRHPVGFVFIFWAELAERASFYGMRVLLALYLVDVCDFTESSSAITVQIFMALCYLMPLAGGWLADKYLGKYKTIVYFAFPYILGHIILGGATTPLFLYTALLLLVLGSGAIKPNTSTLMGLMYEKEGKQKYLEEAFSYFYLAINFGAFLSSLFLPLIKNKYGYSTALMMPTVLMIVATIIFIIGRRYYPDESKQLNTPKTAEEKAEEKIVIKQLLPIFILLALFWFVYDQNASTWVFFARNDMDLTLYPLAFTIAAEQLQALNPALIICFTPLFNLLWRKIEAARGQEIYPTSKMMVGFILVTGCMGIMSMAGFLAETGKVSVWIMVLAIAIMTMAELCISVVGLRFVYTEASPRMKSTMMAAFLLSAFMGDGIGAGFDHLYDILSHGIYFGIQAVIIGITSILFYWAGKRYQKIKLSQQQPTPGF